MEKVRIDKWLWSVRIYKSRTKANAACKSGKISLNDSKVKPSQDVEVGQVVHVKKNGFNMSFKILQLLKSRRAYSIAKDCYEDLTPDSEYQKFQDWYIGKNSAEVREKGDGRPTKKDRRELEDFKKNLYS